MPHRQHRNANAAPPQPRRKRGMPKRAEWVEGTLVELDVDAGRLTLRVTNARRAHIHADAEVTIDVADAVVKATDGDGNGKPGLTDLFPGDALQVVLAPGGPTALTAARVSQRSPGAPVGGLRRIWRATRG